MKQQYDIFLSFATPDESVAQAVVVALEKAHLTCWFCRRTEDNPPGEAWASSISHALKGCQTVVLLYSAAAGASKHVRREIAMADALDKPILTIRLDTSPLVEGPDFYLGDDQFLDCAGKNEEIWLTALLGRLGMMVVGQRPFPLDSIACRELKVAVTESIIDILFPQQRVTLIGIGLGLSPGPIPLTKHRERQLSAGLREELARCVRLTRSAPYGLFTVESKEHLYLLVGLAPAAEVSALEIRLQQIARVVQELSSGQMEVLLSEQSQTLSTAVETRRGQVECLFTQLGKVSKKDLAASLGGLPAISTQHATDEEINPELKSRLHYCIQQARQYGLQLPQLRKADQAATYLRELVNCNLA